MLFIKRTWTYGVILKLNINMCVLYITLCIYRTVISVVMNNAENIFTLLQIRFCVINNIKDNKY